MYTNRKIVIFIGILILVDLVCFFIRGKKQGFKPSSMIAKKEVLKRIVIYILSLLLLAIVWFMEFGLMGNLAISACSLMAIELQNRYFLLNDDEEQK